MTSVATESLLGYRPCSIGFLTCGRKPVGGQRQAGSLTGAVASERVSEALKGSLRMVGNHSKSAKAKVALVTDHGTICSISKKSLLDNQKKVKKFEVEVEK